MSEKGCHVIPNEIVFHAFEGISFVDEDFFCGGCEEDAK